MPDATPAAEPASDCRAWDLRRPLSVARQPGWSRRDLDRAEAGARPSPRAHAGNLADLSGAALAAAIAEYERIEEVLGRVMSYAQLLFSGDSNDPAIGQFYQSMNERVTAICSHLIFFTLELNRLDDAALEAQAGRSRRWRAAGPGCATCACSARTSSPTSWRSCCTRRT